MIQKFFSRKDAKIPSNGRIIFIPFTTFLLASFKMMDCPIINGADLTMLAIWQAF
jgi:hypothetical protein